MANHPRILAIANADAPYTFDQTTVRAFAQDHILGPDWREQPAQAEQARLIARLFAASRVETRQSAIDIAQYYRQSRTTGERMQDYQTAAYSMGRDALTACLRDAGDLHGAGDISDFVVVSCTGYSAPGLDIQLARDEGMRRDVRRVIVGHMGCFGAVVGLRQCLAAVRAYPGATAALLSVELTSLHFSPTLDPEVLTALALFGDAAACALIGDDPAATGPELVDVYCAADFASADQISWVIADEGFIMGLSPRVPVTLRRNVAGVVEGLLQPHGLAARDVAHWVVHPGGPSILDAVARRLELSDEQMALSWEVLRDRGNCSSATVLLILERLIRSGRARRGEWCVLMAFGPGLTLETCLLRF
ncbi:MAG: Naringenin-chalcone synthase [Ktedonobacterales bacterium]|nr:MAG: Naringenin-chalcone synthase [Ktedonobacterales bacterium]